MDLELPLRHNGGNRLYSTGVFDVMDMAQHARDLLDTGMQERDPIAFVDKLATFRSEKPRFCVFASKFAHFFVDYDRYPLKLRRDGDADA